MICVTGDTHIPLDIHKLSTENFKTQKKLTRNDYVIICGDFGGIWNDSKENKYWMDWLNNKNFTTLFIDGNHENHHRLNENYDVIEYCGSKAHRIMDNIYHLMRGQIFTIDDLRFFTMGGAHSQDKEFRREGISWWAEEMPSDSEYAEAVQNLEKHNWSVDCVITHCTANSIQKIISIYDCNRLTNFLEDVKNKLDYKRWFFGHYHIDRDIDDKHTCLLEQIVRVG